MAEMVTSSKFLVRYCVDEIFSNFNYPIIDSY